MLTLTIKNYLLISFDCFSLLKTLNLLSGNFQLNCALEHIYYCSYAKKSPFIIAAAQLVAPCFAFIKIVRYPILTEVI